MKNNTWFLVVNPKAGHGRGAKHWKDIQMLLKNTGISYNFAISQYAGQVIELAQKAVLDGYRKIVAVGGDGTANEVINGMFDQDAVPTRELTFAIIPVGTGNDWIKTHKIPNNYKKSILLMNAGNTIAHDIGKILYHTPDGEQRYRYFINVAGAAYDAFVTKATLKRPSWGKGQLYYLYLILSCVTKFKATPIKVTYDNQEMEHAFFNITVGQCRFNGGGTQVVPHAIPNDGKFALTLFKDINPMEVITKSPRFYNGSIINHKECFYTQAKYIRLDAPENQPAYIEADGEWLGQTPIEFIMLPHAINVIVP